MSGSTAWRYVATLVGTVGFLVASVPAAPAQRLEQRLIQDLRWRNIGNGNQMGRISAIDALDDDWTHVVVGTAGGGVWKSVNAGTTWTPIFDNYGAASIGDVSIFQPNPDIIWVGTGEECGRNSAAWGNGVYKSTDGGKTFQHMGLRNVYTIGSVVIHPTNPEIVYVAALGNIWSYEGDRGLFKTTDGGETWTKLTNGLPNDGRTGALYLVMDPGDPQTLYVSFWERHRTAYKMDSGGPNGGIFKTVDGGGTWHELTNGLPEGPSGKIGLAISRSDPNVLMAHYEHGFQPPPEDSVVYNDMTRLGSGIYRSEDGGESWEFVNRYFSRPFYYNHVAISPVDPELTYHFNQDFMYSTDGGRTLHEFENDGGGHCWHAIWLDPHNKNRFYTGSDGGVTLTHDGGRTWVAFKNLNVTQYYEVGIDLRDPYYVCGGLQDAGSSCGPSLTRTDGIYLHEWYEVQGGDGFHVEIDPTDWRTVYSLRDPRGAGPEVLRTNIVTMQSVDIRPNEGVNILNYDEYITPEIEAMQLSKGWGPAPKPGEEFDYRDAGSGAFRWNWDPPIVLSPHDPNTVYLGANHLFESTDRGNTWRLISPDLSKNHPVKTRKASGGMTPDAHPGGGAEYYGTIITIGVAPFDPDVIWVGTDDGNVQVTRNGGETWTNIAPNIPGLPAQTFEISRVLPSRFDASTAFVTIDGHESGNFQPWVFKTTDYGATWTDISSNLPDDEPIYAIEQDHHSPELLFVGTEFSIYYSITGGERWTKLNNNLPTVAVHDIVVHPRDPDIIIGTHGRGIWIMDEISGLQQFTPEILASDAHLFENEVATQWLEFEAMDDGGAYAFIGENPTKNAVINYWIGPSVEGTITFEISDDAGRLVRRYTAAAEPGINKLEWDMRVGAQQAFAFASAPSLKPQQDGWGDDDEAGPRVEPGTYRIRMLVDGNSYTGAITVRPDPLLGASDRRISS